MSGQRMGMLKVVFPVLTTMTVIVMAIVGFIHAYGADRLCLDWDLWRYSKYSDGKTFARMLHIKNGDTVEKASSTLGLGMPKIHTDLVDLYRNPMGKHPSVFPEGVETGDVFLEFWGVQPGAVWLQARNGKLVNYDPENFRDLLDYK